MQKNRVVGFNAHMRVKPQKKQWAALRNEAIQEGAVCLQDVLKIMDGIRDPGVPRNRRERRNLDKKRERKLILARKIFMEMRRA